MQRMLQRHGCACGGGHSAGTGPRQPVAARPSVIAFAGRPRSRKTAVEGGEGDDFPPPAAAAPKRGRPRKATAGADVGDAAAAAAQQPSEPPPPAAPAATAKRRGRKPRATASESGGAGGAGDADAAAEVAPGSSAPRSAPAAGPGGTDVLAAAAAAPASSPASETSLRPLNMSTATSSAEELYYIEAGRDVTDSQELDALEDVAQSRAHFGFSDPMHSMEEPTFHHEQELLPAAYGDPLAPSPRLPKRRPRAAPGGEGDDGGGAEDDPAAAAAAARQAALDRWRAFKAGELPEDEMEYYRSLQEADANARVPPGMRPATLRDVEKFRVNLDLLQYMYREWEQDAYLEDAFAIHHYQNETGVNRYMNARQLAGYLAQVELEDHQNPDRERMRFPAYARAEHRFAYDYDRFNDHLKTNMEQYLIKLPPGAEDAEDVDMLDDVLLLEDTSAPTAGDADEGASKAAAGGLDQWLVGVLPGGGGAEDGGAGGVAYMDDILGEDADEELVALDA